MVAFEQNAGLRVEAGGALIADGTAQALILLTGTQAVRGWWNGIHIRRSNRQDNLFDHVTIEYGGQDDPFNQYDPGFALRIGGPAAASGLNDSEGQFATIANPTLRQSAEYGLFIRGRAQVAFQNNRLTENALGAARMPSHVAGADLAVASGASATITESGFRYAGPNQFGSYRYGLRVTSSSQVNDDACQVNTFVQNAGGDCRID